MMIDLAATRPEDLQAEIADAFAKGRVEGVATPAEVIETELNRIFLAGDRAYKLKRAVRRPFVDFRAGDQRKNACQAELDVNRALGSPFYLHTVPIRRTPLGFTLGGTGDIVDWLVVMTRFPAGARFDELAATGELAVETIEATGSMIAGMHAKASPSHVQGHAADYRQIIHTLQRTEEAAAADHGLVIANPDLYIRLDAELARLDPLLEDRRAAGKVRRVHGDLHLGNICIYNGKPTPFDALEFDPRLATIDVVYDVAFLLMDLESRGLRRHANAAMNRYWDEAGESECALALLPFFMALRAGVRMAVAVQASALAEATRYRNLALSLLEHHKPAVIAIGGLSGSGKSTVAKAVAPFLPGAAGARILRSDVLRKRAAGLQARDTAPISCYQAERRAEIYRDLIARAAIARRSGTSVIADATFQLADARAALDVALPDCRKIWLDAPLDLRVARVCRRQGDPSDADAAVATRQQPPASLGEGWRRLDGRRPASELADLLLEEPQ